MDIGDTVIPGQVLCILEAMKLFNELKADTAGVRQGDPRPSAQAVEYGELLFELEPVPQAPRSLGARVSNACSLRIEARSPSA